jgi:hypothetical protein
MYEYLAGVCIIFIIWLVCFVPREDLRRPMLWSGLFYIMCLLLFYVIWLLVSPFLNLGSPIIPGYWNPDTLFDIGRITFGLSIEDLLFMFFVAGISAFLYDYLFREKISKKQTYPKHIKAIFIGLLSAFVFGLVFHPNLIYALIVFGFAGTICLWFERRDLIRHSILGGFSFLFVYIFAFFIFNQLFPYFISTAYNFNNISGLIMLSVPLEEYIYAISFGMLWAPIYEYVNGNKDVKIK